MYLHCDYCEREAQGVRRGWDEVAQLGKVESAVGMLVKAPPEKKHLSQALKST